MKHEKNTYIHFTILAIWNFDNGHDVMKINGLNNNRPQNIINIINNQINEIKECAVKFLWLFMKNHKRLSMQKWRTDSTICIKICLIFHNVY